MTVDNNATNTTKLYVGNLSPLVSEELLLTLFGQIGECKSCKIINESGNNQYAFIGFAEHKAALEALNIMNKRNVLGKEIQVDWATGSYNQDQVKVDSKANFHIFVGDLDTEIESILLRETFTPFGEIVNVKIIKDPQTLKNKCYGFISFVNKFDAEAAIASMNGQWLGTRKIRVNWATRKSETQINKNVSSGHIIKNIQKLEYNDVWSKSTENSTIVYCSGLNGITVDVVRNTFALFGPVLSVNLFSDRGYAFIRLATKKEACNAICGVHGMNINGAVLKCSWGKENKSIKNIMYDPEIMNTTNPLEISNHNWTASFYKWPIYQPNMNYWQNYPQYQSKNIEPIFSDVYQQELHNPKKFNRLQKHLKYYPYNR